jgi:hypothetical protein
MKGQRLDRMLNLVLLHSKESDGLAFEVRVNKGFLFGLHSDRSGHEQKLADQGGRTRRCRGRVGVAPESGEGVNSIVKMKLRLFNDCLCLIHMLMFEAGGDTSALDHNFPGKKGALQAPPPVGMGNRGSERQTLGNVLGKLADSFVINEHLKTKGFAKERPQQMKAKQPTQPYHLLNVAAKDKEVLPRGSTTPKNTNARMSDTPDRRV